MPAAAAPAGQNPALARWPLSPRAVASGAGAARPPMGGQGWASRSDPGSGPKKSKNKFKKFDASPKSPKNIDADLRGNKKLLERRISFVPAKKAENGDIAPVLDEVGAGGARTAHARQDVSPSAATVNGKKRAEEEQFQEVDPPLYPRNR